MGEFGGFAEETPLGSEIHSPVAEQRLLRKSDEPRLSVAGWIERRLHRMRKVLHFDTLGETHHQVVAIVKVGRQSPLAAHSKAIATGPRVERLSLGGEVATRHWLLRACHTMIFIRVIIVVMLVIVVMIVLVII